MRLRRLAVAVNISLLSLGLVPVTGYAKTKVFYGKVVWVADGDTITVLHGKTPVKIGLHGVDTPEKRQPYGQKAKRFTTELVSRSDVKVKIVAEDRYGKTVAKVYYLVPTHRTPRDRSKQRRYIPVWRSLQQALVRAGLAWWYKRYAPKDTKLQQLEEAARKAKRGLWSDPHPIPPWDWRRGKQTCEKDDHCILRNCCCKWLALSKGGKLPSVCNQLCDCTDPPRPAGVMCDDGICRLKGDRKAAAIRPQHGRGGALHGNVKSRVFHAKRCKHFNCKDCTAIFKSAAAARRAGYRSHKKCMNAASEQHTGRLSRGEIQKVINKNWGKIRQCLERELLRHSRIPSKVKLEWVIMPNGSVRSVRLVEMSEPSVTSLGG